MRLARKTSGIREPAGRLARLTGAVSVALLAGAAGPAAAQVPRDPVCSNQVPQNAIWEDTYIREEGQPPLHADVFRPNGISATEKTPVVLLVAPYVGNETAPRAGVPAACEPTIRPYHRPFYTAALDRGYRVVQVALRGSGASGGCADFMGPGEQADAARAIRWAAEQPWSTGRVATYGGSYEAWTQVAALAQRVPGHVAAVMAAPIVDPYRIYYMNRVPYIINGGMTGWYQEISSYGFLPPPATSSPEEHAETLAGAVTQPGCTTKAFAGASNPDPASEFWRERELSSRLAGVRVPVLMQAGMLDHAVKQDQFPLLWDALEGPKRLWLTQDDHSRPDQWKARTGRGQPEFIPEALRWLDRHVKGLPESQAPVHEDPPVEVQEGYAGDWRTERRWPPADALPAEMSMLAGSYQDAPGNKAEQGNDVGGTCTEFEPHCVPVTRPGQGSWTFTRPFDAGTHIAGTPRLRVSLRRSEPAVNLFAFLYDIDASNRAALISRGAYLTSGGSEADFDLHPQDWQIRPGHRLGVLLSGSDDLWFLPRHSGTRVEVTGGSLTVPLLGDTRTASLDDARPPELGGSALIQTRTTFPVDPAEISGREVAVQRAGRR